MTTDTTIALVRAAEQARDALEAGNHWHKETIRKIALANLTAAIEAAKQEREAEPVASDAYDKINRYLRNNLDDVDYDEFSTALDAIYNNTPQPQVPAGWQLVPVEPTPEMLDAGLIGEARYARLLAAAPKKEGE